MDMTTTAPHEVTTDEATVASATIAEATVTSNHLLPNLRRVLVVDDNEQNRILLRFVLQSFGLSVLEANDGKQAIDVALCDMPDVILMDLSMPVMDGFEATQRLKAMELTKTIPVIAISAFCDDPTKHQRALSVGCTHCIEKPIRLPQVKAALQIV